MVYVTHNCRESRYWSVMLEEECFAYWTVNQIVPTIVLHPPDNDRDVLLSAAHDPAVEESIQITADEMRQRLYKLNRDSSAGNSGSTNRLLRFITEDRDVTIGINNPVNGIAPPNALHQAFTALCNKALRGEINGTLWDLMTTARLIMIPKPDGGYRPIRVVCSIQRVFGRAISAAARRLHGNSLRPYKLGGVNETRLALES